MRLVLGLPGLLAAGATMPSLPGLAQLLRAGETPLAIAGLVPHALATRHGIAADGDWPLAALRAQALGLDPGRDWWLAADPVTLVAGRDDVRVAGPVADLSAADAAALVASLDAHFAVDDLRFIATTPQRWLVRSGRSHAIATQPLARAIDSPLRELLPRGRDSPIWRRWQNEIEMLLHAHPVNALREARALPPANGLWFSDGGALPRPVQSTPGRFTFAGDDAVTALAIHAGEPHAPVPESLAAAQRLAATGNELVVVLPAAIDPAIVEANWTGPAWRALLAGALTQVTVLADGRGRTGAWEISRPGLSARVASRFSTPDLAALLAAAGGES